MKRGISSAKCVGVVCLVTAAVMLASVGSPAVAAPVESGDVTVTGTGLSGTINFAVFPGGDATLTPLTPTFVPGLGSPAFDSTAKYVYLYQPTASAGSNPFTRFNQNLGGDPSPTSWGYFNDEVFTTSGSQVTATTPLDAGTVGFAPNPSAIDPSLINPLSPPGPPCVASGNAVRVSSTPPAVVAEYPAVTGCTPISALSTSTLVGFTSNLPPSQFTSSLDGTIFSATGTDPAPTPEPSAVLLWCFGLATLGGLGRGWWRRPAAATRVTGA